MSFAHRNSERKIGFFVCERIWSLQFCIADNIRKLVKVAERKIESLCKD